MSLNTSNTRSFLLDLVKFSPVALIFWFLCHVGVIPDGPIALIAGYILGMSAAMIEDWLKRLSK